VAWTSNSNYWNSYNLSSFICVQFCWFPVLLWNSPEHIQDGGRKPLHELFPQGSEWNPLLVCVLNHRQSRSLLDFLHLLHCCWSLHTIKGGSWSPPAAIFVVM
jgi:hypothetical protein